MVSGLRLNFFNESYFDKWSCNMAYVLGFTCADGCVYRRTLSWDLGNKYPSDKILLESFLKEFGSSGNIEERNNSFRLRFNSVYLVSSLAKHGIFPNKTKDLLFPYVPKKFIRHFLRGFLDGDGWISIRDRKGRREFSLGFVCASRAFLEGLVQSLEENLFIANSKIRKISKVSEKRVVSVYYSVEFYGSNAYEVIDFLYSDLNEGDLFLARKFEKQLIAKKFFHRSKKVLELGNKWVRLEEEKDINIHDELRRMFLEENMLPREIALNLGVSLATIYRWLDKSDLRAF